MKKLIMILSFVFSANLLKADDVQSATQKMEFILERIMAFDEKGVEQLLQHTPFTQREIEACINYIEKYGVDLIDPGATERITLAIATPAITFSVIGLLCKFEDEDILMPIDLRTLICAYVAFSLILHSIVSYGNSAIVKNKLVKLTRILRRLLAYPPQEQVELAVEAA